MPQLRSRGVVSRSTRLYEMLCWREGLVDVKGVMTRVAHLPCEDREQWLSRQGLLCRQYARANCEYRLLANSPAPTTITCRGLSSIIVSTYTKLMKQLG